MGKESIDRLKPQGRSKATRNEQRKLRATYFNSMAIAMFVAGALPIYLKVHAAKPGKTLLEDLYFFDLYSLDDVKLIVACLITSIFCHALALACVHRLED